MRRTTSPYVDVAGTSGLTDAALRVAELALMFGRVYRAETCRHPDGGPESDTDHTVMLAWLAPALASATEPKLDPNLVAAFAAVHDAVEVFAGDTNTLRISEEGRRNKKQAEAEALWRWREEFATGLTWLPSVIGRYETQEEPEARFVRAVDKICPKFLHVINVGRDMVGYNMGSRELTANLTRQREDIAVYAGEFKGVMALFDEMADRAVMVTRQTEQTKQEIEVNGQSWQSKI